MEEDWDSPTGYSPIDTSTTQNTARETFTIENQTSQQRSRGRGFGRGNPESEQNWRRKEAQDFKWGNREQDNERTSRRSNGFVGNESRFCGRGVLSDRNDASRRGRGYGFGHPRGGGLGQSRQSNNWQESGIRDQDRNLSQPVVMQVDSSLVGRIIGGYLDARWLTLDILCRQGFTRCIFHIK